MQCLMNIPYVDLAAQHAAIKDELLSAVSDVLNEGKFVLGPQVKEFEDRFAALCGVKFALGVNSGTDALIMALRALGVGPGDEVITCANSFVSTASCIVSIGATPVFVDVADDANLDPRLISRAVTERTKAIIPVHWTGHPARMDEINAVAKEHGLAVIEDAAQAVCAEYQGRRVGSFGAIGCFSLHPLKTLNACGDGGVITTDDERLYDNLYAMRNNGFQTREECVLWSNNSRLDTIQAAMLLVKLKYVEEWTDQRRKSAQFYREHLKDVPGLQLPPEEMNSKSVYHTFVLRTERRDALRSFLAEKGIKSKVHYAAPIHLQPMAKDLGYQKGALPKTEEQAGRVLSIPVYSGLKQEEVQYIVDSVKEYFKTKGLS